MLWTVTPNPAVDYTYRLDHVTLGTSHRVSDVRRLPGGKGLNVARVADSLGAAVTVTGFLGGDSGAFLSQDLAILAPQMTQKWINTTATTRNSVTIVAEETTLFNEAGAPVTSNEWNALIALMRREVADGDVVCISGSFPPDTPSGIFSALRGALRTTNAGLIIDTSGEQLVEAAAVADLVKPNEHELLTSTGTTCIADGARILHDRGCMLVAVSRGSKGMELWSRDWVVSSHLPSSLPGNPTGAGDAAVAAIALHLEGKPTPYSIDFLREILIDATATSAAAVIMPTAGEIDQELRKQLLTDVYTTIRPLGDPHVSEH